MYRIVRTIGPYASLLSKVYTKLNHFDNENIKSLVIIFDKIMQVENEPNDFAANFEDWFVTKLVDLLDGDNNGNSYFCILKACTYQREVHKNFLKKEILKKLTSNIINSDAPISVNSSNLLEMVLVSDLHQDIISRFVGENYDIIIEVLKTLISKLSKNVFYRSRNSDYSNMWLEHINRTSQP